MNADKADSILAMIFGENDSSAAAVDHVFMALAAEYGASWDRSLGNAPLADVKTIWGQVLSDFMHTKEAKRAILWGLKNLPDTVVNARQFRTLCRQAPAAAVPQLPAPKVNPEIAAKVLGELKATSVVRVDHKAWAKAILADVKAGIKRNPTSVRFAEQALGVA